MLYLNEKNLERIGIDWNKTINVIEEAVRCLDKKDFSQPIKLYLRYKDLKNRIIAMPAYIGGSFNITGIKWIASFPDNIKKGIARANSVVILNNADTGKPIAIINAALLSIIRTASVSGLITKYFDKIRKLQNFNLGIIGFGPIGQYHLKMFMDLFGDRIDKVFLYDLKFINKNLITCKHKNKIIITDNWERAYLDSDVFITCTVSKDRYINKKPKSGSLQLNVSLRDYKTDILKHLKNAIIVDDWDEVCRENTDIEIMHKEAGLKKEDVKNIIDVVCRDFLKAIEKKEVVMFNPMGMGVFDIAIGQYYYNQARKKGIGKKFE
ncbi:MAG: Ornithine cyclodeaminase/mu-crystallin family protein [Berkelbacteria bacterium GW2011_GWA1_36_9]|uniref:Ornithine cyclodeaminase/mu-crystallin family protein n=1 Tax=Berkelbacteria bacterium GW2011_GWA1_36_9 TaxID=1618331 RepID=A0A0G0FVF5_9BACT|nr:MAG: Ornithine cyclodeaminase/mu-crystallin family protein [Berkelbacteria bacterium GW2011_GWA1_36_9]